jgi:hypothetical protein
VEGRGLIRIWGHGTEGKDGAVSLVYNLDNWHKMMLLIRDAGGEAGHGGNCLLSQNVGDKGKFKANLGCIANSRPTWAAW